MSLRHRPVLSSRAPSVHVGMDGGLEVSILSRKVSSRCHLRTRKLCVLPRTPAELTCFMSEAKQIALLYRVRNPPEGYRGVWVRATQNSHEACPAVTQNLEVDNP